MWEDEKGPSTRLPSSGRDIRGAMAGFRKTSLMFSVALVALPLASCGKGWNPWVTPYQALCPRPQLTFSAGPGFNQQQQEIRNLRQRAFGGDFFSQLELGRRYEGQRATDRNLDDPVEAAVWYADALANPAGYTPILAKLNGPKSGARFDDCRSFERRLAYSSLNKLLLRMTTDEQTDVRNRLIYVQTSQGADGLRTLGRIYDQSFGPFGEPADNREALEAKETRRRPNSNAAPAALALFTRNDVDAYLFNYLAAQTGDISAYVMLKDFERSSQLRSSYGQFVEQKAKRWTPFYEFYPPDAPESGVPHSDESDLRGDVNEAALARIDELPSRHVVDALKYLRVLSIPDVRILPAAELGVPLGASEPPPPRRPAPGHGRPSRGDRRSPAPPIAAPVPAPLDNLRSISQSDIKTFQAMLGRPQTGVFRPIEQVRAIQYAAVNGSPKAQLVLAVMYTEEIGVARDYAKAFRWFEEAERKGSPEAKYAMSTFFSLGMAGVADQDRAKAVVMQIDAALAGFSPSVTRLQQILAQVSRAERRDPRDERFVR